LIGDDQLYQLSFINVDIKDIHIDLSMFISYDKLLLVGGFNPSEKYESQLG